MMYPLFPLEFDRFFPRKKSDKSRGKSTTSWEKSGENTRIFPRQTAPKWYSTLFLQRFNNVPSSLPGPAKPCPAPATDFFRQYRFFPWGLPSFSPCQTGCFPSVRKKLVTRERTALKQLHPPRSVAQSVVPWHLVELQSFVYTECCISYCDSRKSQC